ncbi:MAG: AMP-binding protein, partial [Paracoccaceae bacterium]
MFRKKLTSTVMPDQIPHKARRIGRSARDGQLGGHILAKAKTGAAQLRSVPGLLARNAVQMGSKPAYREKEFGIWQTWSWADTAEQVENLALGLLTLGVKPGDFVAVIGRNRPY